MPPFREAEVENLEPLLLVLHQVVRFQIPVDDALLVRRTHRIGEGNGQLEELVQRQALLRDQLRERLPLDQLHRDEVDSLHLLHRIDVDDVGMVERRQHFRLALETRHPIAIGGELVGQNLERDVSIDRRDEHQGHEHRRGDRDPRAPNGFVSYEEINETEKRDACTKDADLSASKFEFLSRVCSRQLMRDG